MRWENLRRSENVEDRRALGGRVIAGGGIGTLILVVIVYLLGGDPRALLDTTTVEPGGEPAAQVPADDREAQFVSAVLGQTEDVWDDLFRQIGRTYEKPRLVLFAGRVESACGFASAAVGPFYCPGDRRVYLDLNFFRELSKRFRAPGDFAEAYVIAHEIGHHVQNQLGTMDRAQAGRGRDKNDLSVRLELQADYLAGVWAHHAKARNLLEVGDIEEAMQAATAVGDDTLQKRSQGYVVPESFTHGTSQQRVKWFRKGLESGDPTKGDTFSVAQP